MRKWLAAILAVIQIFLLTACSVNLPMVSESTETDGYSDAQTMLVIATERNRYRKVYMTRSGVWRSVTIRRRSRRICWTRSAAF